MGVLYWMLGGRGIFGGGESEVSGYFFVEEVWDAAMRGIQVGVHVGTTS